MTAAQPPDQQAQWQLADGTEVTLRPIRADDAPRLQALHRRLSPDSIYHRFLDPRRELPEEQARRLAAVDYRLRMAFVASLDAEGEERVIGVARYDATRHPEGKEAEVAVVVEDAYQGQGLGSALLSLLAQYALQKGIEAFLATVHVQNRPILHMIQRSGLPHEKRLEQAVWEVRIRLPKGGF